MTVSAKTAYYPLNIIRLPCQSLLFLLLKLLLNLLPLLIPHISDNINPMHLIREVDRIHDLKVSILLPPLLRVEIEHNEVCDDSHQLQQSEGGCNLQHSVFEGEFMRFASANEVEFDAQVPVVVSVLHSVDTVMDYSTV